MVGEGEILQNYTSYAALVSWKDSYYKSTRLAMHRSLFVSIVSSSPHIEFNELYRRIFILNSITTESDFNVIGRGIGQLYIEPRW